MRTPTLDVSEVSEGRWQITDGRGRYVAGFPSKGEAAAFCVGYKTGRMDARDIVDAALESLPPRIDDRRTG